MQNKSDANSPENPVDDFLEQLRVGFRTTRNGLMVWRAIAVILTRSAAPWEPLTGRETLPTWILDYLRGCAMFTALLSAGIDPRKALGDQSVRLTNADKIEIACQTFGFSRPGWNAFAEMCQLDEMYAMENLYKSHQTRGSTASQAMNEVLEMSCLENERSVRRRFAARRNVFRPGRHRKSGSDGTSP